MATSSVPELDQELRLRLERRFGSAIDPWFAALPGVLDDLAEGWEIEWDALIQRGSMSVVIRCRTGDGRPAVLKATPERERVAHEAAALASWKTNHVPELAPAIGSDASRLLGWCAAFAAMVALELAEASDDVPSQVESLMALASRA